jgi:hypothetical protein
MSDDEMTGPEIMDAFYDPELLSTDTRSGRSQLSPLSLRLRAASHELRCAECRVSWRSWWRRIIGDLRGYNPRDFG